MEPIAAAVAGLVVGKESGHRAFPRRFCAEHRAPAHRAALPTACESAKAKGHSPTLAWKIDPAAPLGSAQWIDDGGLLPVASPLNRAGARHGVAPQKAGPFH